MDSLLISKWWSFLAHDAVARNVCHFLTHFSFSPFVWLNIKNVPHFLRDVNQTNVSTVKKREMYGRYALIECSSWDLNGADKRTGSERISVMRRSGYQHSIGIIIILLFSANGRLARI